MDQAAAQFQRSLVLKRQSDLSSLQADMEMLRKFDQDSEAKQSKWTKLAIASVLGGIALVVAVNVLFEFDEIVSVITAVAFAASFIFCLVRMFRFRRTNLDNRRYELCDSLLELIRVDLDHSQPVTARLDCRHPGHKDKLIRKGKAGTWDVKYYADPWLELSGRFLDGTTFHLTKTELLQKRSKRKRSRSGKIKFKSKTKKGFEAELLLRFKPDKYRHMATLKADAAEAIQVPEPVVVKRVRFDDRAIGVKVAHKGEWRASPVDGDRERGEAGADATRTLAMMMLSLYQVLQLSKAIDKDAASGAGK